MTYQPSIVTAFFRAHRIPKPEYEFRFHPVRKWRLDVAWPEQRVALEIQGGIFTQGRHTRGAALLKEWEKLNTLASMGWRVVFCQPRDLLKTETADYIAIALRFPLTQNIKRAKD